MLEKLGDIITNEQTYENARQNAAFNFLFHSCSAKLLFKISTKHVVKIFKRYDFQKATLKKMFQTQIQKKRMPVPFHESNEFLKMAT